MTAAVGVLLAATAIFGLPCFSPFVVLRLLPIVEGAAVAQGVRGGPLRAAQQVQSLRYQHVIARRMAGPAAPLAASGAGGGSSGASGPARQSPRRSPGSPAVVAASQRSSHRARSDRWKPASEHDGGT